DVDTTTAGYHQETLVPLSSESHSGEDVALHGIGPGSQLIQGVIEQSVVFHLINQSLDLLDE
ncbi:alkaline phosphatase, partial [Alteromonas sp. 14N.309.X.WAT.G.H12]|uniref:alkaline phosphatase n=1 Tax=Alteromonas sp. 14N.309.X.WAT.G.H12 TaxID=3120824 RepID=UPI002FD6F58B